MKYALAFLCLALATACEPRPPDDVPGAELVLEFSHVVGTAPLALGTPATTRYGHELTFSQLRYWVSNVRLVAEDGSTHHVEPSYFLIEQSPRRTRTRIELQGLPPGRYTALTFDLGVDRERNHSLDRMAGELAVGLGMDWTWNTGYVFFNAEGTFVERSNSGEFSYHIGQDDLLKRLTATFPQPLELTLDTPATVRLEAAVDRLFAGVDLGRNAILAGGPIDSPAAQLAGNYARMFRLTAPLPPSGAVVPLTATSPNLDAGPDPDALPTDGTPPRLEVAPVDLDGMLDPQTLRLGSLDCSPVVGRTVDLPCLGGFAPATRADAELGLLSFVTAGGAQVRASSAGIVEAVRFVEHSELSHTDVYDVIVRPNPDSAFFLVYGGVKLPQVATGDTVAAGQPLGLAADHFSLEFGRTTFRVERRQEATQRLCATRYTSEPLTAALTTALEASRTTWPDLTPASLCTDLALVCQGERCTDATAYLPVQGDVDNGRRIYKSECASCHGTLAQGDIAPALCLGGNDCGCTSCTDHPALAARIQLDMPPEGHCDAACAADVAAFLQHLSATAP